MYRMFNMLVLENASINQFGKLRWKNAFQEKKIIH